MNDWGWNNWGWNNCNHTSGVVYWPQMATSSGSGVGIYPSSWIQPQQLAPVLESPSADLGDREWLEAQIAEVCELAEAA